MKIRGYTDAHLEASMHLPATLRRTEIGPDPLLGDRSERQTPLEEQLNVGIHFTAMCLSVVGLGVLLARSIQHGTALHVTAATVYGASMVILFLCSSLSSSPAATCCREGDPLAKISPEPPAPPARAPGPRRRTGP